eukprot:758173-Rhodomonas_salina.1
MQTSYTGVHGVGWTSLRRRAAARAASGSRPGLVRGSNDDALTHTPLTLSSPSASLSLSVSLSLSESLSLSRVSKPLQQALRGLDSDSE